MSLCLSVFLFACHLIFLAVNFAPLHPCTFDLCTFAPLALCTFAPLHLCTFVPLHLCTFAPLHLCTFAPLHLCSIATLHHVTFAPLHIGTVAGCGGWLMVMGGGLWWVVVG